MRLIDDDTGRSWCQAHGREITRRRAGAAVVWVKRNVGGGGGGGSISGGWGTGDSLVVKLEVSDLVQAEKLSNCLVWIRGRKKGRGLKVRYGVGGEG